MSSSSARARAAPSRWRSESARRRASRGCTPRRRAGRTPPPRNAREHPGGPAEAAGIQAGDVSVQFDDREVEDMRRLPRLVAETEVDRSVDVEIIRQGERRTVEVELGELEEAEEQGLLSEEEGGPAAAPEQSLSALGLTLAELTDELRQRYSINPTVQGVVITRVEPGSPAAEKGQIGRAHV